jgi:hypothetical protein
MKISKSQLDLFVTQLKACTSVKTKLTVRGSSHVNTIDVGQLSPFTLTSVTFTGKCIRTNASFFLEQFSRKSNGTGERSSKTSETSPTEKKKNQIFFDDFLVICKNYGVTLSDAQK